MKKVSKWEPLANIPGILYLYEMTYNRNGLILLLQESDCDKMLNIHFKPFFGFRNFDESYRMKTLSETLELSPTEGPWTLFVSEHDELIQWLEDENYGIIDSIRNLKNYIISTPDDIVDIVSEVPPIVCWQ